MMRLLRLVTRRRRLPWTRAARGKLVGMMPVRDEDWVLGLTLRAALAYCDAVVLTDHRSRDDTAGIIAAVRAEFPQRELDVRRADDEEWQEMDVRQEMLERARSLGGTHFAIIDADELPTGNLLPRLRQWALSARPGEFLSLPMVAPYHALDVRRIDAVWGEHSRIPWCFADAPGVGYAAPGADQLHRRVPHSVRDGGLLTRGLRAGGTFHLQFVDRGRLEAKAVWYKLIETLRYPGRRTAAELDAMYDWTLRDDGARMRAIPDAWWRPYRARGWLEHLRIGAHPWQREEARRLLQRHGSQAFAGLDLHGIAAPSSA